MRQRPILRRQGPPRSRKRPVSRFRRRPTAPPAWLSAPPFTAPTPAALPRKGTRGHPRDCVTYELAFPLCLSFSLAGQPPLVSDSRGSNTATRTTRGVDAEPNDYSRLDSEAGKRRHGLESHRRIVSPWCSVFVAHTRLPPVQVP